MKHRLSWILGVGLVASACGDDGEVGGSGSSSGTEGTTMGSTSMQPTTMQPTTDAMTGEATSTGPDETTAAVDSSGTAGESESGSTGPSATGSSSGEPPEDPAYPPCMPDADPVCPEPYDHCYEYFPPGYSACSQTCQQDDDCPQAQSGDAVVTCAGIDGDECVLDCADDATCPDGMECVEIPGSPFLRCAWPDA
jgi:hypothetical protein